MGCVRATELNIAEGGYKGKIILTYRLQAAVMSISVS